MLKVASPKTLLEKPPWTSNDECIKRGTSEKKSSPKNSLSPRQLHTLKHAKNDFAAYILCKKFEVM